MSIFSAQNAGGVLLSRERIQPTFGATFHDFSGDSENVEIFFSGCLPYLPFRANSQPLLLSTLAGDVCGLQHRE